MGALRDRLIEGTDHDRRDVALAHVLADGRPHALDALATIFADASASRADAADAASRAALLAALGRLDALGMTLSRDEAGVRSPSFVPLTTPGIAAALAQHAPRWRGRVEAVVSSTNATLVSEARSEALALPYVLAAELQEAGRGRRGRGWRAAPGASLTASFAWRVARPGAALEGVSLACGLAVRDVLVRHGVDAQLKWPNDVLVAGRKLAGILVESSAHPATLLVVGVGINVRPLASAAPGGSALPVTDLAACGWPACDRNELAAEVAAALDDRLAAFIRDGFAPLQAAFDAADAFRGLPVSVHASEGRPLVGIERGVDADGALLLECDGRLVRCIAGDVSVRPSPP